MDSTHLPQSKICSQFWFIDLLYNLVLFWLSGNVSLPDSFYLFSFLCAWSLRSAPCGPRDQGAKFSARLVETVASRCHLDPRLHPPTPPPRRGPRPSRPGANSPSACTLLPVRANLLKRLYHLQAGASTVSVGPLCLPLTLLFHLHHCYHMPWCTWPRSVWCQIWSFVSS